MVRIMAVETATTMAAPAAGRPGLRGLRPGEREDAIEEGMWLPVGSVCNNMAADSEWRHLAECFFQ